MTNFNDWIHPSEYNNIEFYFEDDQIIPAYIRDIWDFAEVRSDELIWTFSDVETYWTRKDNGEVTRIDRKRNAFQEHLSDFKSYQFGYIKQGIIAECFRYLKPYKEKILCRTWKEFCEKFFHLSAWQVNNLCKAARVAIELIKQGFTQLPNCCAQAIALWKLWKKRDPEFFEMQPDILGEMWDKVIYSLPKHSITARSIEEIAGEEFIVAPKPKIAIDEKLRDRLVKVSAERGESIEQTLAAALDKLEGKEPLEDPEEKTEPVSQRKLEKWEADLETMLYGGFQKVNGKYYAVKGIYEDEEDRFDVVPIGEVDLFNVDSS